MRLLLSFIAAFLTLGSIGPVVVQMRPPVPSDFGGGGLGSPIYVDGTTGIAYFYYGGAVHVLNDQSFVLSNNPTFTGTVQVNGALNVTGASNLGTLNVTGATALSTMTSTGQVNSKTFAGATAGVLNDNQVTVSGSGQDVGAVRGFATLTGATVNGFPRGVESQTSVPSGASFSQAFGLEVGLHSQVAGTGATSVGIYLASSHTGWLPSGVRNDVGLFIVGEDGWKFPIVCLDTDNTTNLFTVTQTGGVYGHEKIWVSTAFTGTTKYGVLNPSSAPVGETWFGLFYDTPNNVGRIEGLTQGTAFRNIALNAPGGNVLIGSVVDDTTGAQLQMTGVPRFMNGSTPPAGGATTFRISMGNAGLGIYGGSGAPTLAAGKGSLYLRTDGAGGTSRAYINTDGSTTWTAINTVA